MRAREWGEELMNIIFKKDMYMATTSSQQLCILAMATGIKPSSDLVSEWRDLKGCTTYWWFWGKERHYNQCVPIPEPTKHWRLILNLIFHRGFWLNSGIWKKTKTSKCVKDIYRRKVEEFGRNVRCQRLWGKRIKDKMCICEIIKKTKFT